eukprot:PhF_6_TR32335/c0_g1_i3/m.47927
MNEFVSATQNAVQHFVRLPTSLEVGNIMYDETKQCIHVPCKEVPPTVERPLGSFLTMTSDILLYNVSRQKIKGQRTVGRRNDRIEHVEATVALVTFELPGLQVDNPDDLELKIVTVSPLTDDGLNVIGVKIKLVGELYNIPPSAFRGYGPRLADVNENMAAVGDSGWSLPPEKGEVVLKFDLPPDGCVGASSADEGMRSFVGDASRRTLREEIPITGVFWNKEHPASVAYVDGLLI